MSRQAIAAALSLPGVSAGERLAAFSLASFANREQRAWPGWRVAAARAGLSKSQYLASREGLERRGLIVIDEPGGGRGNACWIAVRFAELGPWFDGEVNAPLFEAVLGYSRSRGSARLLLATLAALADDHRSVDGLTVDEIRAASGMAESTYRRAHDALLASGELMLEQAGGGRSRMNRWLLSDPRAISPQPAPGRPRRVAPGGGQTPLMFPARRSAEVEAQTGVEGKRPAAAAAAGPLEKGPRLTGVSSLNGAQSRTFSPGKDPGSARVSVLNPCQDRTVSALKGPGSRGVPGRKGAQSRTVWRSKTPPLTPPETPPPNAGAGREPQNPRTIDPPSPPEGGSGTGQVLVEETYITPRGRRRRRLVAVELGGVCERLRAAGDADVAAWEQVRALLREAVGESTFEIWLAPLELIAVDVEGTFLMSAPTETVGWVAHRFGWILDGAAQRSGRGLHIADEAQRKAAESLAPAAAVASAAPVGLSAGGRVGGHVGSEPCAADTPHAVSVGSLPDGPCARRDDQPTREPTYRSAYPSSYTDVYTQTEEVS